MVAVVGLVANAVLLVVRGRVKENAVLRTLGYPGRAIAWLVVSEGGMLGLLGGVLGVSLAAGFLRWQSFTMGNEGQTLAIRPDIAVIAIGIGAALLLGVVASLWPAWRAISQPIVARCARSHCRSSVIRNEQTTAPVDDHPNQDRRHRFLLKTEH